MSATRTTGWQSSWHRLRGLAFVIFALAFAGLSLLSLASVNRKGNLDDAMILLVYIRHFLESGSFYWNRLDGPVDGFTSMLDLRVKAAFMRVLHRDPYQTLWLATTTLHAAVGGVLALSSFRLSREALPSLRVGLAFVAVVAFAASPALAQGSWLLLETPLYVLVVSAALATLFFGDATKASVRWALCLQWLLLALVRPEGIPLTVVLGGAYFVRYRKTLPEKTLYAPLLVYGLALLGYFSWHVATFGYMAPNTHYAKCSDSRWLEIRDGWRYLRIYSGSPGGLTTLVWCAASPFFVAARWTNTRARWLFATVAATGCLSSACVVYARGDSYYWTSRFLAVPIVLVVKSALTCANYGERSYGWAFPSPQPNCAAVPGGPQAYDGLPPA